MQQLTRVKDNVYTQYSLVTVPIPQTMQTVLFTVVTDSIINRLEIVSYLEGLYETGGSAKHTPPTLTEWGAHVLDRHVNALINNTLAGRYPDYVSPWIHCIRLDITLTKIHMVIRTTYGTKTSINNFISQEHDSLP